MEEVQKFLKACGVYYLATMDGDQPRVRPFGTAEIYNGKLYIQTSKVKNVSKQIQINPKVEICGMHDGEWIRISGKLVRDDDIEAKKYMLDMNPTLKSMYSAFDDNTEVLYFDGGVAVISSFTASPRVIEF